MPAPCRMLKRVVLVPCQRASIAAQAQAQAWERSGRAVFTPGQIVCARANPAGLAHLENYKLCVGSRPSAIGWAVVVGRVAAMHK